MTATRLPLTARQRAILEDAAIHDAACRYRRQGLVCSTCADTVERAAAVLRALSARTVAA